MTLSLRLILTLAGNLGGADIPHVASVQPYTLRWPNYGPKRHRQSHPLPDTPYISVDQCRAYSDADSGTEPDVEEGETRETPNSRRNLVPQMEHALR